MGPSSPETYSTEFRIGPHVQRFGNGGSASFIAIRPSERFEASLKHGFAQIERFATWLNELPRDEYLVFKHRQHQRQQTE
jgi:hypothetical protein